MSKRETRPSSVEDVEIVRYFFALPEPVGVPHGFRYSGPVGNRTDSNSAPDDPEVTVVFHHADIPGSPWLQALTSVVGQASGLPGSKGSAEKSDPSAGGPDLSDLTTQFTVVEAFTVTDSPDTVPAADLDHPERYPPRADPFMRCLRMVNDVVRALRHASEAPHGLPTYQRVHNPVLHFIAEGTRTLETHDGQDYAVISPKGTWEGGGVLMLDHLNLANPVRTEFDDQIAERFEYWLGELRRGSPLLLWRERSAEARRARIVHGDTSQAIVLANTASEVLLDVVLALLMWEEGLSPTQAAGHFEEGKVLKRLKSDLTPRLKGSWSTERGTVGQWFETLYKVRHRVVHAGYTPTPAEADEGMQAAAALEKFVFDRIASQRNTYKRATLITLAQSGLEKRGLWSGQIKRFAQNDAHTEPDWRDSFTQFHTALVAASAP